MVQIIFQRQLLTVTTPEGETKKLAATGAGSVEAIFNTLEKLVEQE